MEQYLKYVEQIHSKRIHRFLQQLEQEAAGQLGENSPYTDSFLSMEVKSYFMRQAKQPAIEPEKEENLLLQIYDVVGLDSFETMCIELALLGEINPYFEKFFIYMSNDWNCGYLTLDTAVRLYTMQEEDGIGYYRYFQEESRLMRYFFTMYSTEGKSRVRWGLSCRKAFFSFLFSEHSYALSECFSIFRYTDSREDFHGNPDTCFHFLDFTDLQSENGGMYYLYGINKAEQLAAVKYYGGRYQRDVVVMDITQIKQRAEQPDAMQYQKESCNDALLQIKVKNAWLCLSFLDAKSWENPEYKSFVIWMLKQIKRVRGYIFILGEAPLLLGDKFPDLWEILVHREQFYAAGRIWEGVAKDYILDGGVDLELLANTYSFTALQVKRILQNAEKSRKMENAPAISKEHIIRSCITETRGSSSGFVSVMDTGYTFEDLVLPKRQMTQLKAACNRIRYKHQIYNEWGFASHIAYGKGVSMLFSGPPGTGKTMTAGIVADYLGTTLYRVDLSAVVSKYIGETEKNLNTVFETVRKGQGVLFFDEADVLFGKRTEVKDSHDKHSNMEAAYLLQKMEEYEGVVILATNYIRNMDEAFKRRLPFMIEFPFPDAECRNKLWQKAFPEHVPWEEKPDYDFLAKQFELSGSNIKNIALQAAFFAAEDGKGVNMEFIIRAVLLEINKTGQQISREDLREYGFLL